jgi:GNAT superfamily N-acetyltransferase
MKNSSSLTIGALDFNLVARQPELLKQFRKLTLYPWSGMNQEIDHLLKKIGYRPVSAIALTASQDSRIVGWGLLSKEQSPFEFPTTGGYYYPSDGTLFEIYVHPDYRRQGIGSELLKVARRKAFPSRLCICSWDEQSRGFYNNFPNYGVKKL